LVFATPALQLVVEELDLEDEEMSQQLTDVLNKLGALEQELSAAVHHSISTSSTSSSDGESSAAAAPPAPTAAAAAAAAGAAASLEPPTAAAAGPLAIEHTVELEALAEAASMGARPDTPVMDVLSVPMVPAPTAAAAVAAVPAAAAAPAAAVPAALSAAVSDPTKLWPLFVLGLSYVHQATSGFALPALLPMVSPDLHLTDFQVGVQWERQGPCGGPV
jgi:pyruvate/2-oxoglutarate dehydrogenase complex dihydrolipoamide acyltransferase (E2) component